MSQKFSRTLHPVQHRLELALATCRARAGACCVGIGPFAALATRRRLDVEALLLVGVGIGVGGTRGGSQGGIILQPGDLALDVADGLASGMPDRNPALTGQLFAVVRRGLVRQGWPTAVGRGTRGRRRA